ncbi:DUF2235 domain-containing protein [Duganella sp. BJB488]|uniref:phospholipase effector Tle1 domain-containing protein n=1 Tax=unclassified Duganella TaxID=2636909 RepID=UPI000E34FF4F|nr:MULTISPECIES: DUF2235 domain-containing protein [unclassified Duganella]RFP09095.1 DUF2235 domain-containing protein [Duganella sp. BJB489]RFP12525.1 DUF2235 domain-containing protein [Duganella sp. BJB488]RFP29094.1 DUF2235 domain-containing protein [Duganella sp. BJB480]
MEDNISCKFSASEHVRTENIKDGASNSLPEPSKCEILLNLGVFFDGTKNNRRADYPGLSHSNIARLSDAYHRDETNGYYRLYVPGVGTPFPEIGEMQTSTKGSAFAVGCEGRVLFGLISMLDVIHQRAFSSQKMFSETQIRLLCVAGKPSSVEDRVRLAELYLTAGLCETDANSGNIRESFFKKQAGILQEKLSKKGVPVIKEYVVDIFGFSRGAAEARVFASWVAQILTDGKLAGIPLRMRFLGIFDTVASAGILSGVMGGVTNLTMPHDGWASAKYLRIPPAVENCVHFVAMHELRKNFPLDEIGVNGVLPKNHAQIAYPGSHSDVGGGYAPGELGISSANSERAGDSLKLSQIPLNHMFDYAKLAGVPLNKKLALDNGYDPFAISPALLRAFKNFLGQSGVGARSLHEWMQPYLDWRWQMGKRYANSLQMQRASPEDRAVLKASNDQLIRDGNLLLGAGDLKQAELHVKTALEGKRKSIYDQKYSQSSVEIPQFDDEAVKVIHDAKVAAPVSEVLTDFFDNFVHDSLAGFRRDLVESSGYWRYRKAFKGADRVFFASTEEDAPGTALS